MLISDLFKGTEMGENKSWMPVSLMHDKMMSDLKIPQDKI